MKQMTKQQIISGLKELANQYPEGFTSDLNLNIITSGIAVALKDTQNSFGDEGLDKVVTVAMQFNFNIGMWFSSLNGKTYWDVVVLFCDEKEALSLAKHQEQISIFDIGNGKEIVL